MELAVHIQFRCNKLLKVWDSSLGDRLVVGQFSVNTFYEIFDQSQDVSALTLLA